MGADQGRAPDGGAFGAFGVLGTLGIARAFRQGQGQGQPPVGEAVDLLTDGDEEHWLRAPRHDNRHTHGTGCTLASALAALLARGRSVPEAAAGAKAYVTGAIEAGFPLGAGLGPVDHAWNLRQRARERAV